MFCICLPDFRCVRVAGSRHEAFFDIDNNFNNDSDDDFMSSYGGKLILQRIDRFWPLH